MFAVPCQFGGLWSATEDDSHAPVVVITRELNDKLFGGVNSVGKTLRIDNDSYTVVGVMQNWRPMPHFYDLNIHPLGQSDEVFIPFTRAIDKLRSAVGHNSCKTDVGPGWEAHLRSDCLWLQYWTELPTAADAEKYHVFLNHYAAEQQRIGRFQWPPHTQLRNVRQWLTYQHG